VIALALWSLLGGVLARMAALQATRDDRAGPANAARFAFSRWPWFVLTPLIPLLVVAVLWAVLYVFGLVFYGIPYVNVVLSLVGSLFFFVALLIGVGMALLLIGYALAFNLLYPAIAVEGTDGFDANSRAFSYVVGRPWHLLFYSFVALIYGAITYLFLGTVVFLALRFTQHAVGSGAGLFIDGMQGGSPFAEMLPAPEFGRLTYGLDAWPTLTPWAKVAALLTMLWSYLLIGLLAAYAVSYYFSAQTWIYLLLRRSADGTDFSDVYVEPIAPLEADNDHVAPPPDKIDPQPPAAPTGPTT
jgi:hypothetical protein